MNVLTQERQVDEPGPPPIPAARIRHLEFNDVRAGRLVAESLYASIASATVQIERAIVRSRELWEVAVREIPLTVRGTHVRKLAVTAIPRRAFDRELAGVLLPRGAADIALVTPEDDRDDDDVTVQWFVEQHAAATLDARTKAKTVQIEDEDEDEDVMLTLRRGPGSTRSWRGGGTMRQR